MDCSFKQIKKTGSSLERRIENINNGFKWNPFLLHREASQWIIKDNAYSDFSGYLTTGSANDLSFGMEDWLVDLIRYWHI